MEMCGELLEDDLLTLLAEISILYMLDEQENKSFVSSLKDLDKLLPAEPLLPAHTCCLASGGLYRHRIFSTDWLYVIKFLKNDNE